MSRRKTEVVVGSLFVSATVASILGSISLGSALEGSNFLDQLAASDGRIMIAAVLFLVAATSAAATAFFLFPILRPHDEGLAAGYVVFRGFENVLYAAGTVVLLAMLTVSQSDSIAAAGESGGALGATLLALHEWSALVGTLVFFGLGALTLNTILYRSGLVPRWLSIWGLLGSVLVLIYGVAALFGVEAGLGSMLMVLAMPIALQEMVFAGWLIAKGFNPATDDVARPPVDRVPSLT